MAPTVCQSSQEINTKNSSTHLDNDFCTKIIFRTEISVSLCQRLRLSASSCVTREGLRALDIHKESSLCVQSSAFSAAGDRGIKLRLLLWSWWMRWVALGGKRPTAYWDWWSMMPLCHAGLHLLYPLRINTSLTSEYKEDVQVVSRKHLSSYNEPALCCYISH